MQLRKLLTKELNQMDKLSTSLNGKDIVKNIIHGN